MTRPVRPPSIPYARYQDGAVAASVAAVLAAWGSIEAIDHLAPLSDPLISHAKFWLWGIANAGGWRTEDWAHYSAFMQQMKDAGHPFMIPWRMSAVALTSSAASAAAGWWAGQPRTDLKMVAGTGNVLLKGAEAVRYFNRISDKDGLIIKSGRLFMPDLHLSLRNESEHGLIAGGTGAGKSVTAWNLMLPAMARGDRVMFIDFKGLTEKIPANLGVDMLLICPYDKRSVVWAIWLDLKTKQQVKDFVARIIPESDQPIWSNTSRAVLVGVIMSCLHDFTDKGLPWSWKLLSDRCLLNREGLLELLKEHHAEGLKAIEEDNNTSASVLTNFMAFTAPIHDMADAWGDKIKGFSIGNWVNNPKTKYRTIILKISSEFAELSKAFNQALLGQMGTYLTRLPDNPHGNPMWVLADEFPRLGDVVAFWEPMMAACRSKGCRLYFSIQSLQQLIHIYGREIAQGWVDSAGLKYLGKQDGEGAKWVSELCGTADFERLNESSSSNGSSFSYVPQQLSVFPPSQVLSQLGVKRLGFRKKGVRMLIHGVPDAELIIDFPFIDLPEIREATVYASWCSGMQTKSGDAVNQIKEIMQAHIADVVDAPITSPRLTLTLDTDESHVSAIEVSINNTAEIGIVSKHKSLEPPSLVDEVKNELLDELGGEVLDQVTGIDHLSLGVELLEELKNTAEPITEPISEVFITNSMGAVKRKKRIISMKELEQF